MSNSNSSTTTLYPPKKSSSLVSKSMQDVLTSTYGLYLTTHNYHWNVEGPNFLSLHALFNTQYNELFIAIDGIAEHIRSLGFYALPFEGDLLAEMSKTTSNALNKETDAPSRALRMLHNLVEQTEIVVAHCQTAKTIAQREQDEETENLVVERLTVHKKSLWMLNSILKQ